MYFKDTSFANLMMGRIYNILLIASKYDAFMLEEDGRIDELIYVDMPDMEARESLFRLTLAKLPTADDIDFKKLASITEGYNCSDIDYIVKYY